MRFTLACFACLLLLSTPALACEYDVYTLQLPGESEELATFRAYRMDSLAKEEAYRLRQYSTFKSAPVAYLAEVIAKSEEKAYPNHNVVRPMLAVKGTMPRNDRALSGMPAGGMCRRTGDGDGAWGSVGEMILVFEGLPKSEQLPNGVDSIRTRMITNHDLSRKLEPLGKLIEE